MIDFTEHPHRRYNILTGEWVLCSPHRTKRPWQGKVETVAKNIRPNYDPKCYLCPTNERMGGEHNPDYKSTFVFNNDFGALQPHTPDNTFEDGLLIAKAESGICRVICFSPDHSLSIADMEETAIMDVIATWQDEYATLSANPNVNHVQIFENKGDVMGCSNPHPHGQICAQSNVPMEVAKKSDNQATFYENHGSSLLSAYLDKEQALKQRIIYENDDFVVVVPFWAVWPYEAMIIPREHQQDITQMSQSQAQHFANAIKVITSKYDRLFDTSFPYSMGIHQRPTDGAHHAHWHWHMSFYPPLLRSATVKKFMVGYEMFGEPQRDITAEFAAQKLREI